MIVISDVGGETSNHIMTPADNAGLSYASHKLVLAEFIRKERHLKI